MSVLLAYDSDEAGQKAAVAASAKIAAWFESWATPKSAGPTAQALASAQATYDTMCRRFNVQTALQESFPTDEGAEALRETEYMLDEVAIYLTDLFEDESHNTDRLFLVSQSADELAYALVPHKVVEDVRTIDWARIKAIDIVGLITNDGAELTPAGGGKWKTNCTTPDHTDTNASMWVYPKTNSFYCWSCQSGGDVGDYLKATGKNVRDF